MSSKLRTLSILHALVSVSCARVAEDIDWDEFIMDSAIGQTDGGSQPTPGGSAATDAGSPSDTLKDATSPSVPPDSGAWDASGTWDANTGVLSTADAGAPTDGGLDRTDARVGSPTDSGADAGDGRDLGGSQGGPGGSTPGGQGGNTAGTLGGLAGTLGGLAGTLGGLGGSTAGTLGGLGGGFAGGLTP